jgi:hypothetical protein
MLSLLASLLFAGVAPALGAPPELSLRYSGVVAGDEMLSGWQASCVIPSPDGRLGLVLDASGYYPYGGAGHVLVAGPRVGTRVGQRTALFAQVLAGVLIIDDAKLFVAHPGVGVDVALGRNLAFRAQVDWPVIGQGGVEFGLARVSLGLVFHPALVRKPQP